MKHDPFYQQIIAGLNGTLDDIEFEKCAADILRAIYPGLTPILGGSDSGMDGAVGDGEGEPFPLVTTTSKDVIGNLRRNLQQYLDKGGKRRRAILATSRSLTPQRRQNLFEQANKLGFTLVNVYDQTAIALLLYREPNWCKSLLGITGVPSALSLFPKSSVRPILDVPLIGREQAWEWLLKNLNKDRILVGHPGLGKTFLIYKLVHDPTYKAYFVVSTDRTELANEIRQKQPQILIVDDAHTSLDLLLELKHVRTELRANYSILATCWQSVQDIVATNLGISPADSTYVHTLDLLTRDEIAEIVQHVGISSIEWYWLIADIVRQSEGRPGLAVTLAHLCLVYDIKDVVSGNALSRELLDHFIKQFGRETQLLLASFALGGDIGLDVETVAVVHSQSKLEVWKYMVELAAGGVISDNDINLSVRPPALREVLVRDVFFKTLHSTFENEVMQILQNVPDPRGAIKTLIGAKRRGAIIDTESLGILVEWADQYPQWSLRGGNIWEAFAWLGSDEVNWVLENYPSRLLTIVPSGLHFQPERLIPILLQNALEDNQPLNVFQEDSLKQIESWVESAVPSSRDFIVRRENLFYSVQQWLTDDATQIQNRLPVTCHALKIVISPCYRDLISDPGSGNTASLRQGYVTIEHLSNLYDLWRKAIDLIKAHDVIDWQFALDILRDWTVLTGFTGGQLSDAFVSQMHNTAKLMAKDIIPLLTHRPSVLHRIRDQVGWLLDDLNFEIDPDFEILYPSRRIRIKQDTREREKLLQEAVKRLSLKWTHRDPEEVVNRIVELEKEWWASNTRGFRLTSDLCGYLAERVDRPLEWLRAIQKADASGDLIVPFLLRLRKDDASEWQDIAKSLLQRPGSKRSILGLVLTLPDPPEELLQMSLDALRDPDGDEFILIICLRNQVADYVLKRLLQHPNPKIVASAAEGEWFADPAHTVRSTILGEWETALIETVEQSHALEEIFKERSDLAYKWLLNVLRTKSDQLHDFDDAVEEACKVLSVKERKDILSNLSYEYGLAALITFAVEDNIELYSIILAKPELEELCLAPLYGSINTNWANKAKLAFQHGLSVEKIARATFLPIGQVGRVFTSWGNESQMYRHWGEEFTKFCEHPDEVIRKIAIFGRDTTHQEYLKALARERDEAIYGE